VARDSCHMVNDHIAGMVAKHPDRLMGMGTVPLQDPGMALTELNRTVKELWLPRRRTLHQCQGRRSHPRRA
jgi:aminocarboxymuconate-semialdehyde decarboxylase